MGASNATTDTDRSTSVHSDERLNEVHDDLKTAAITSPLDTLPTELLIYIFSFCTDDDPDVLSALSAVNHRWRNVILDIPTLWRRLQLSDAEFDGRKLRSKVDLWFKRTGHLPVDIDLSTRRRDAVLPLLSYMLPQLPRWGNVSHLHSRMRFLFTAKDAGPVKLERLLITLAPKSTIPSDLDTPPSPYPPIGQDPPVTNNFQLPEDRLREIYVLGVRSLPSAELVTPFQTVTVLALYNNSTECDFPAHQVVPFLSAFPVLETLELSNFNDLFQTIDPEYRADCPNVQPALLPNLHRLSIRGIYSSRCILSHLTTPKLTSLNLVHINSSTTYEHPLPGEPGDSEDEARDSSRSPWTDHATGMGLRSLFSRCTPPLRELIMDYADLRTKDFKWLFARLPYLELFYIVASDMSDKVLDALEIPTDAEEMSRPVLLPSLMRIKLSKCQNISGDALVKVVASRLQAAERGTVAVLKELFSTECLHVGEEHHQQLHEIFPAEGRLVYIPGFED